MISVDSARKLIFENTFCLNPTIIPLENSIGYVLASDIYSPINVPCFNQAAMDGYAFRSSDLVSNENTKLKIAGEVAAGNDFKKAINKGETVRIFTGAKIPENLDVVIAQEEVLLIDNDCGIEFKSNGIVKGLNVRILGSQIEAGKLALKKGTYINAAVVGYLASLGIASVSVFNKPKVAIIITGSELQKPGQALIEGKIYESNSYMLRAVLQSIGIEPFAVISVADNYEAISSAFNETLIEADLVLFSGGISVGKYDLVGKVINENVQGVFYKIKQKPGKPLFFGKHKSTPVFALPGNPAAALSCFYEYVYPAIQIMTGKKNIFMKTIKIPCVSSFQKKPGLANFLKGRLVNEGVEIMKGQESNILSSFVEADCLIFLDENSSTINIGETVEVHLLPGFKTE